jgi:hypothetical protein
MTNEQLLVKLISLQTEALYGPTAPGHAEETMKVLDELHARIVALQPLVEAVARWHDAAFERCGLEEYRQIRNATLEVVGQYKAAQAKAGKA